MEGAPCPPHAECHGRDFATLPSDPANLPVTRGFLLFPGWSMTKSRATQTRYLEPPEFHPLCPGPRREQRSEKPSRGFRRPWGLHEHSWRLGARPCPASAPAPATGPGPCAGPGQTPARRGRARPCGVGYCGEKRATGATPTGARFSSRPFLGLGFLNKTEVLGDQISEVPQSPESCDSVVNPEEQRGTPRGSPLPAGRSHSESSAGGGSQQREGLFPRSRGPRGSLVVDVLSPVPALRPH